MTDATLWASWRLWLGVAALVVLIAATLLVVIWLTARSILSHAVRALGAAEKIRERTQPIWELQTSNEVAGELRATVGAINEKATLLAEALEAHAGTAGAMGGDR